MSEEKQPENENANVEQAQQDGTAGPQFNIQRLYLKDVSLEVANSPQVFLEKWEPELNLDVNTASSKLEDNIHEVILTLTATVKLKENTAFLVEVKQAGIFAMHGFADEEKKPMLGAFCPNLLYPYARQVITTLVAQAGFPPVYLQHINFDALYQQHEQQQAEEAKS